MLDVWGGRFADIARNLEVLSNYGIEHCVVIVHDWQRSGYDNASARPTIRPPQTRGATTR